MLRQRAHLPPASPPPPHRGDEKGAAPQAVGRCCAESTLRDLDE